MRRATLALSLGAMALVAPRLAARPVTISLPAEQIPAELSGDEAGVVTANCGACHSLDYIVTQPRGKGAQFWRDAVTKMITVYKAPIEPTDADAVSALLARKFG